MTTAENGKPFYFDTEKRTLIRSGIDSFFTSKSLFSPDGKTLLTVNTPGTGQLWDVEKGDRIGAALHHKDYAYRGNNIRDMTFSHDSKLLVTAGEDKLVKIWDVQKGKQIGIDIKHTAVPESVEFHPNGKWITTTSDDSIVRQFNIVSGKQFGREIKIGRVEITAFKDYAHYSADGKELLTNDLNGLAVLHHISADLDIPKELFKLQMQAITDNEMNMVTNRIERFPSEKWEQIRKEYFTSGAEHFKTCQYREYNYWSKCYPEEAKKIK